MLNSDLLEDNEKNEENINEDQSKHICFYNSMLISVFVLVLTSSVCTIFLLVRGKNDSSIDELGPPIIGFAGIRPNGTEEALKAYDVVKLTYINAIEKAGGIPITIPVVSNYSVEKVRRQMELVDALLIQGGNDVYPSFYGEAPDPLLGSYEYETDLCQIEMAKQAEKRDIPILGICRGMQLLNVAFGGSLYQDISYFGLPSRSHSQENDGCIWNHTIDVYEDSILASIFPNNKTLWVNSFHHQAVKKLANGFAIDGKSPDGLIEAFHMIDSKKWIFATQFHPEQFVRCNDVFLPIFEELVKQARLGRSRRKK